MVEQRVLFALPGLA